MAIAANSSLYFEGLWNRLGSVYLICALLWK